MRVYITALLIILSCQWMFGQNFPKMDSRTYDTDSVFIPPRRPWVAGAEVVGVNLLVGSFNRYLMNQDFAKINFKTIKSNFKTGPVWDVDKFSTNLIAHPYHGSLYFNAARSNGMNFWESIPFTIGGSFMWEFFMETEPPSINDLFTTTFGGVELGEITYRLSDLFIDDRSSGWERVGREVAAGVLSPIRAFNRIISGDAWRRSPYKGRAFEKVPVSFIVNVGPRYLAEREDPDYNATSMNISLRLDYGEPYGDDFYSPYEWFQLRAGFDFFSKQPLITQVNAIGALWGKTFWSKNNRVLTGGVFQHFDYYDSAIKAKPEDPDPPVSQTGVKKPNSPYKIAQAAAVGVGLLYNKISEEDKVDIYTEVYANGIALGASQTDYFFVDERDYNLGSGYSVKMFAGITYKKRWSFLLNTENYHIFTWKGYDPDLDVTAIEDFETLNVQGDKGNARLTVFTTNLTYFSGKRWNLSLTNRYFSRRTQYKYHDDVDTSTMDVMLSFGVRL